MTERPPTLTVRLSAAALRRAQEKITYPLEFNVAITALVLDVVAGTLAPPAAPEAQEPLDGRVSIRSPEQDWVGPAGLVDERFTSVTHRNSLVRNLIYALADDRLSVSICYRTGG